VPGLGERHFGQVRRSSDGRHILFSERKGRGGSLHIHDTARGVTRRLKTGGFDNSWFAWSPDGQFVAFTSDREEGQQGIYRMPADGSGEPEPLVAHSDAYVHLASWSIGGDIAFLKDGDIWILQPDGEERALFTSEEFEAYAAFSPDGQWITYASEANVYVRAYPGPGPAILVADRAWSPSWSHDGRELYFFAQGEVPPDLLVVEHQNGTFSAPRKLMTWPYKTYIPLTQFDTLPDGSFLTAVQDTGATVDATQFRAAEIRVILNFDRLIDRASRR
jgi:Tol biopolymer transport system component